MTDQRIPEYLWPLAESASRGVETLLDRGVELPSQWNPRRSAVLVLIAGGTLDEARIAVEERGHRLHAQPGQFSFPGGGVEPRDADDVAAAVREAREETGLDPADVQLLGAFAPIPMPWRNYAVRPVIAWAQRPPPLHAADPREVERVTWAPLVGEGSLTDPAVVCTGKLDGNEVGTAFDLPDGVFVWGFTAYILRAVLDHVVRTPDPERQQEVPHRRRRTGRTPDRGQPPPPSSHPHRIQVPPTEGPR